MGVRPGLKSAKQQAQNIKLLERGNHAITLGLSGMTFEESANVQHVSSSTIRNDYKRALQAASDKRKELGELLLQEHLSLLEQKIAELQSHIAHSTTFDQRLYDT